MPFTEALRILIDADTRGAVQGIQQVGATTERELGKSQKRIDAWSRGLTRAGVGMVALGGAALVGLGKAAMASEEANLATVKLENTLRNMPALAGENSKQFIDLAEAIQGKTAADADQIIEAEALLGTFRLTGREIRDITPLVVDLARKFGIDMNSAAIQVGKALDGQIGALKRNGISIDEAAFATDRYAAVTEALRTQVGGFAEDEGKTFAGSIQRMKNELGDLAEGVGSGAVDAFSTLFGFVDAATDKLDDLSPSAQNAIGKFATFGSVALIAGGALSFTIGQLIKMKQNFDIARVAVADFAGSGGLGRLARVSLVVGGLVALREVLMSMDRDLEGIDVSTLENQLLDLAQTGKLAGDQLAGVFEDFGDAIESGDPQKLEAVADKLGEVDKALAQLASRDPEAAAAAFKFIDSSLRDLGASGDQIKAFFDDYAAATTQADTASRTAAGGADELTGAMGEQGDATTTAQEALQEYSDTLSALFDPLFGATDALMDNAEAQAAVRAAELELIAATQEHGTSSAEAAEAQQKLTDAHRAAGKSAFDVDLAFRELNAAVADNPALLADAKASIQGWVAQGLISEATAAEMARQFDGTANSARELGATDPNVKVSETGGSRTRGTLSQVQQAAINAGRQRPNIPIKATDRATRTFNIVDAARRLLDGKSATVFINVAGATRAANALASIGRERQHGGPVRAGEAYVVGERQPELFVPDRNGMILPSLPVSPSGGAGSVGGSVVNIDMRGAFVTNEDVFVRKVATAVNKGARLGLVNR